MPGVCVGEGGVRDWGPSGTACAEARTCAGGPNNDPPPCSMCKDMWRNKFGRNSPCPRLAGRPGIGIQHPLGTV